MEKKSRITAWLAVGVVALAAGVARQGDYAARAIDDLFRVGERPRVNPAPRPELTPVPELTPPPKLTPVLDPTQLTQGLRIQVEFAIDDGASVLRFKYGAAARPAREAATSMACNVVYTTIRHGRAPTVEEWITIVLDALESAAIDVPPGSAPWRGLEGIKNTTAAAIVDPTDGEVHEATVDDLLNDLGCESVR